MIDDPTRLAFERKFPLAVGDPELSGYTDSIYTYALCGWRVITTEIEAAELKEAFKVACTKAIAQEKPEDAVKRMWDAFKVSILKQIVPDTLPQPNTNT